MIALRRVPRPGASPPRRISARLLDAMAQSRPDRGAGGGAARAAGADGPGGLRPGARPARPRDAGLAGPELCMGRRWLTACAFIAAARSLPSPATAAFAFAVPAGARPARPLRAGHGGLPGPLDHAGPPGEGARGERSGRQCGSPAPGIRDRAHVVRAGRAGPTSGQSWRPTPTGFRSASTSSSSPAARLRPCRAPPA